MLSRTVLDLFEEKMTSGTFINYIISPIIKEKLMTLQQRYITSSGIFSKRPSILTQQGRCSIVTDTTNADRLFSYIYDMVFDKLVEMTPIS